MSDDEKNPENPVDEGEKGDSGDKRDKDKNAGPSVAKMASHAIFQYNVLVIDIDNTTLGLI